MLKPDHVTERWIFTGQKDVQSVTPDWRVVNLPKIAGVTIKEVAHVPTRNGHVTELLRTEWLADTNPVVGQVFQRLIEPGAVSAWHAHALTTDRLFCVLGRLQVVLFDGRTDSPTVGQVSEHLIGTLRPTLIVVPPGVWHGVMNVGLDIAILINMVDVAYDYADPDSWRVPPDSACIPYRFRED